MVTTVRPRRVNHINVVVDDFDAAVAHLRGGYGAEFLLDLPCPEWHACLIATGQTIFELFEPAAGLLNARYGPHYLGIEYQVDMAEARRAVAEHGIRVLRDIGNAFHTHPADCFGIAFEFYEGEFHALPWPLLGGATMQPINWWRDQQPLGLTGLAGYTVAVRDGRAAKAFFTSLLGATPIREEDRPGIGAYAIRMQIADSWVEMLAPTGDGVLRDQLDRYGEGIFSTVFGIRDMQQAADALRGVGITSMPGSASGRIAAPASAAFGVILEFQA